MRCMPCDSAGREPQGEIRHHVEAGTTLCEHCTAVVEAQLKEVHQWETAAEDAAREHSANGSSADWSFTIRQGDPETMRPLRFLWRPWLILGRLNLIPGEEAIGKGMFSVWVTSQVTHGRLAGGLAGKPADVLWIGADEDDWHEIVQPRLYAAGADLARVYEFCAVSDAKVLDVSAHAEELNSWLERHPFGLVVFEQLMDVLPEMKSSTDPLEVRRATRPLRRVLAARQTTGLGALHVNKAKLSELRQRMQGSVQFNALARATILIDRHPQDGERRIAVLGKRNYVPEAEAVAMSFEIERHRFSHGGRDFDVGRLTDVEQEALTVAEVLAGPSSEGQPKRDRARADIVELAGLGHRPSPKGVANGQGSAKADSGWPMSRSDLARQCGYEPDNGTFRRALEGLEAEDLMNATWPTSGAPPRSSSRPWRKTRDTGGQSSPRECDYSSSSTTPPPRRPWALWRRRSSASGEEVTSPRDLPRVAATCRRRGAAILDAEARRQLAEQRRRSAHRRRRSRRAAGCPRELDTARGPRRSHPPRAARPLRPIRSLRAEGVVAGAQTGPQ
jgi:AAA domain